MQVLKLLPKFKYHPDPVGTGAFIEGEAMICPCCGKESTVYYATIPYSRENVENLCPVCISNGEAAKKYDELFHRTHGYLSWQGEYWLSCCNDYCAYLGSVGTKELNEMGIADEVFKEYNKRNEFDDIEEYLVKDGSVCGYLFRCLHCEKHHLWVDADWYFWLWDFKEFVTDYYEIDFDENLLEKLYTNGELSDNELSELVGG